MSIPHFKNLSAKRKDVFINHIDEFTFQEKLDGTNLIFGRTEGRFWTARKNTKEKFYSPEEWGDKLWVQNFVSAHKGLETVERQLVIQLGEEFVCHAEILSDIYPNTIKYYPPGSISQIVIFNHKLMHDIHTHCKVNIRSAASDAIEIEESIVNFVWEIKSLKSRPAGEFANTIRNCAELGDEMDLMIEAMLTTRISDYGHSACPIEGLVFTHQDGWMTKVVSPWFQERNREQYEFRRKLFKTPGAKSDSLIDQYTRDLNNGLPEDQAKLQAFMRLMIIREEYLEGDHPSGLTHWRNLDALASLYHELKGDNGR